MVLQSIDMVTTAYTISVDIKIDNYCISNVLAIVDTGSPIRLLKEKLLPFNSTPIASQSNSDIVGINGSELVILNQTFFDISQPNNGDPISIVLNIIPNHNKV